MGIWGAIGFALLLCACSGSVDARPEPNAFDHGTGAPPGSGGAGGEAGAYPKLSDAPYPDGPYGTGLGATIEDVSLLGWSRPDQANYDLSKLEKLNLSDYYDPEGVKPFKLVWLSSHAMWCGACNQIFADMRDAGTADQLHAKGVEHFATLFENAGNPLGPASPKNLALWGAKYEATSPLALDPAFVLAPYYPEGLIPANVLIETKSMRIVGVSVGGNLSTMLANIDLALDAL